MKLQKMEDLRLLIIYCLFGYTNLTYDHIYCFIVLLTLDIVRP